MISEQKIIESIPNVLKSIELDLPTKKQQGKVRDFYVMEEERVIVTTDRQSAFDVNLGHIPYKGAVLNSLAAYWFDQTKHIVPNHMVAVPHPNVLVAKNCQPIPIEIVVRGYITGVTKTSAWYSYQQGEREIYGLPFPDGLKKNQQLPSPIITPTTHGGGADGHDERLTKEQILERKLVEPSLYEQIEKTALALFAFGTELCKKRGLILVDTKYEFGLIDDQLTLMDEVHTPDSSRFWIADTYAERFENGQEPENFDKEFLRLWYADKGYTGDGAPPAMSQELLVGLAQRYIQVYEKISGETFTEYDYPVNEAIQKAVADYLND